MNALDRREFLKATAVAALGVTAVGARALSAETAGPRTLKKGMMLSGYPGKDVALQDKFKAIKDAGFAGVEVPSHLHQEEVLRARDEAGLEIPSVSCGQHSRDLGQPSADKRAAAVEGVKQALRDAKRYGASSILVVPGSVSEEISYADNYQRTQAELSKAVPLAEELGVKLAIENVWNHFLLSPLEAGRYVDEFKSPAVGWHFDVGNVIYLGWPEQWIRLLGKRIQKLHIKEFSRKKMNEEGFRAGFAVEYLEGDNDWPAIMKALAQTGYSGWAIAEPAWRPPGVPIPERLKQISALMDRILSS